MDVSTWAKTAETVGIPAAVLFIILLAIFWGFRWTAFHIIKPGVSTHLDLVKTLTKNSTEVTGNTTVLAQTSKTQQLLLKEIFKEMRKQTEKLEEINRQSGGQPVEFWRDEIGHLIREGIERGCKAVDDDDGEAVK